MLDNVGEALKIFLEGHLIPTVISVVAAIAALLLLPSDYWMLEKIGEKLFFLLIAGIVFLVIQLIMFLGKGIRCLRHNDYTTKEYNMMKESQNQKKIEEWLSFIDKLPPDDREMIYRFLNTDNKPIMEPRNVYRSYNSIRNTNAIIMIENRDGSHLLKLEDHFYQIMKKIYETRGSISHFD